jgi:hypothetical protein
MVRHVITQREDAMQPQTQHPGLQGWQRLAGRRPTEATHPALPGTIVTGQATFEWLEDQRFLIWRSHYDHPEIPDAIAVTGIIDGKPSMHYFDPAACTGYSRPTPPRAPGDSGTTHPGSASDSQVSSARVAT